MVEGARLERVYRATYLGFEPLAVRHTPLEPPIYGLPKDDFSYCAQTVSAFITYSNKNVALFRLVYFTY